MYNAVLMEGLRERKKRQTRELIAVAAMELFQERGFDSVTVADVARAADVSEKTVFNYFPTKEDLVFARGDDRLAERADAIRMRPPGVPLSTVFRAETTAFLDQLESGETAGLTRMIRLVRSSPALRDRLLLSWEREAAVLVAAVTEAEEDDDLVAAVVVRSLVWAHRLIFRAAIGRLLEGDDPVEVAQDLRVEAERAYSRLDLGLAGYGG
jgi:AcrR family transcriptional regulator